MNDVYGTRKFVFKAPCISRGSAQADALSIEAKLVASGFVMVDNPLEEMYRILNKPTVALDKRCLRHHGREINRPSARKTPSTDGACT
jgi:hypothetical protein